MSSFIVAVSLHSLFQVESRIAGCANCTDRASVRFERLLDSITAQSETTAYVLPAPAVCPMCQKQVLESTMVQLRVDADGLVITNRSDSAAR